MTWQALPELMGAALTETAIYFDSCRALRNTSDYDRAGVVTAAEVDELLGEAEALHGLVLRWLAREYPQLTP